MLILLYTKNEFSYDRFHEKQHEIYQLVCDRIEKNGTDTRSAIAAMVQGPAFKQAVPEIESFTRVYHKQGVIKKDNHAFSEDICWVDENFFSVFSFPLVSGSTKQALSGLRAMVLTEDAAQRYFGTTDIINMTIELQINGSFETFTITGVARQAPRNSSIKFSILVPFKYLESVNRDNGWMWFSFPTFFVLNPYADLNNITARLEQTYLLHAKEEIDMNHEAGYDTRFQWGLFHLHKCTSIRCTRALRKQATQSIRTFLRASVFSSS